MIIAHLDRFASMSKLLHVVMLKRAVNVFMAENNSESVDVDPPLQHFIVSDNAAMAQ